MNIHTIEQLKNCVASPFSCSPVTPLYRLRYHPNLIPCLCPLVRRWMSNTAVDMTQKKHTQHNIFTHRYWLQHFQLQFPSALSAERNFFVCSPWCWKLLLQDPYRNNLSGVSMNPSLEIWWGCIHGLTTHLWFQPSHTYPEKLQNILNAVACGWLGRATSSILYKSDVFIIHPMGALTGHAVDAVGTAALFVLWHSVQVL